jgi:hypothetical protein
MAIQQKPSMDDLRARLRARRRPLTVTQQAAVRRAWGAFARAIPGPIHSSGHWAKPEDLPADRVDVPNGIYRVSGADWILRFQGGVFVEAFRAAPPDFGGPDVVAVPS